MLKVWQAILQRKSQLKSNIEKGGWKENKSMVRVKWDDLPNKIGEDCRLLQCLHQAFIRDWLQGTLERVFQSIKIIYYMFWKMVTRPIVVRNNFQVGLDINRIKIRHLKGENKRESSRRPDSNGLDSYIPQGEGSRWFHRKRRNRIFKSSKTWSNS